MLIVQVDAFIVESKSLHLSCNSNLLYKLYRIELFTFGSCEDFIQGLTVKQCLLWVTCTGRHWLIALQITIGSTHWSVTASSAGSLYCDLSAAPWRWSSELLVQCTKYSTITGNGIMHPSLTHFKLLCSFYRSQYISVLTHH